MSMREHYLTRAAELHARACNEPDESTRREYANLARQFLRLADETQNKTSADPPERKGSTRHLSSAT